MGNQPPGPSPVLTILAYLETNLPQFLSIDQQATVKHKGRLGHAIIDVLPVNVQEFLPFSGNNDGLLLVTGLSGRVDNRDILLD